MISVIINVYNGEKYIRKCLDCVVNQTYKDLEILIVNDGSTDNTQTICESYKDERIRIINQENMGLALSRNVGIDNAHGEYLYFIDCDDWIDLDTIEYLYHLCKNYNTDISTCRSMDVHGYNFHMKKSKEEVSVISSKEMLKKIFLSEDNAVALWNKLVKKELFNNLRFEKRIINDITLTHKLILASSKIAYSNQFKYYYLKHKESICAKKREDYSRSTDMYMASIERYNYVKNIYPDFIENDVGILELTARLYLRKNKKIIEFLNEQNAKKLYNEMFSLKILKCRLKNREKIKLILFRISPKLHKCIINFYLEKKGHIK